MNNPVKDQTTPSPSLPSTVLMGNIMHTHTQMKVHIEPNDSGIPWSQQCMTAFTCEERLKGEEDNNCEGEKKHVDVAVTDNTD